MKIVLDRYEYANSPALSELGVPVAVERLIRILVLDAAILGSLL
jgi:hypothetical protein